MRKLNNEETKKYLEKRFKGRTCDNSEFQIDCDIFESNNETRYILVSKKKDKVFELTKEEAFTLHDYSENFIPSHVTP